MSRFLPITMARVMTAATLVLGGGLGCGEASAPLGEPDETADDTTTGTTTGGHIEVDPAPPHDPDALTCEEMPSCDPSIVVAADGPALLITDPVVLAELPLKRVLEQIWKLHGSERSPEEALQRLFDTMNTSGGGRFPDVHHCDEADNPSIVSGSGDSPTCPRAEGSLAFSEDLLATDEVGSFVPVAVVNRFDLTPFDGSRCGQYRIIYARQSGLLDPDDRVFLIFEAALENPLPGCLETCRPVANFWRDLQGRPSPEIADRVSSFFFDGLPHFKPVVHPIHYGLGAEDGGYGALESGQIRMSMHMEDPWIMRELRVDLDPATGSLAILPTTVKSNPPVALFDPTLASDPGEALRAAFVKKEVAHLAGTRLQDLHMFSPFGLDGAESVLSGDKKNDYLAAAIGGGDASFADMVTVALEAAVADSPELTESCPTGDPLDATAIFRRATGVSCAGCHAPGELLGQTRAVGCGLTWPDSLGQVHVDEQGQLSPALRDVFLPHRAGVLGTFLQACDEAAIGDSLRRDGNSGDSAEGQTPLEDHRVRTLGGSTIH